MKKSNKLLLAGFLVLLLSISGVQLALYAKYKSGNYTVYAVEKDPAFSAIESFNGVKSVRVENVSTASIVFSDVAVVDNQYKNLLEFVRNGDSILIRGKSKLYWDDSSDQVLLHLPTGLPITLENSFIIFRGGKMENSQNAVLSLRNSTAIFSGKRTALSLESLKLQATDNSKASIEQNAFVRNLNVHLLNSSFSYNENNPVNVSILTDSISRISLPYKLLTTAKITTTSTE